MKKLLPLILLLSGCAGTYLSQPKPLSVSKSKIGDTVMTLSAYEGYYIGKVESNLITGGDWPPLHVRKEKLIQAIKDHSGCKIKSAEFDPTTLGDLTATLDCTK